MKNHTRLLCFDTRTKIVKRYIKGKHESAIAIVYQPMSLLNDLELFRLYGHRAIPADMGPNAS